jgi:molybdopterin synthase catalytic subunit
VTESSPLQVAIVETPIDVAALLRGAADAGAGAVLSFVGTVRDEKHGRRVVGIDYEAYPPMALRVLERIGTEMIAIHGLRRAVLVHRIGALAVGDASVAIVVAAAHRAAGFDALRHGIEAIKRDVPIWKKERFVDGAVWVQEGS